MRVAETFNSVVNPQQLKNDTCGELTWLDRKWDEKFYPIPTNDIQLNPKLGQNPGW